MKVSSIGKGIAVASAVGLTALAYVKGKNNLSEADKYVSSKGAKKVGMALGNGFKTIGEKALKAIKGLPSKIKGLFNKAPKDASQVA